MSVNISSCSREFGCRIAFEISGWGKDGRANYFGIEGQAGCGRGLEAASAMHAPTPEQEAGE